MQALRAALYFRRLYF